MSKIIRYYACGHTANGHVNYLMSNLNGINKVVILEHKSNALKTNILRRTLNLLIDKTNCVEVILSCNSERYIDGIIFRNESIAFLSNHLVDTPIVESINISLEKHLKNKSKEQLEILNNRRKKTAQLAYHYFNKALQTHDHLEKIYIEQMDFNKANKAASQFVQSLFQNETKQNKESHIYKRLFGTNTMDGAVNVVDHLISNVNHRVYVKGRAGTGKSFFMRKVLQACQQYGFDVEVYYCSFDPNSIDMLIIRELDYCLFDSTPPHEFFPERKSDLIIDLYELAVKPDTDIRFKEQIKRVTNEYQAQFQRGLTKLSEMKYGNKIEKGQISSLKQDEYDYIIDEMLSHFNER